jgi:DNA-binding Lrp family transcriptional regulator
VSPARKSSASRTKKLPGTFRAFVLIQTVPGRVEGVLRTMRRLEAVQSVDSVTGPYDIVAMVEVDTLKELSHLVAGTIGGLRGVTRTYTLLCTE